MRHLVCTVNDIEWSLNDRQFRYHLNYFTPHHLQHKLSIPIHCKESTRLCVHIHIARQWEADIPETCPKKLRWEATFQKQHVPRSLDEKQLSKHSVSYKARSWLSKNECQEATTITLTTWRSRHSQGTARSKKLWWEATFQKQRIL